MEGIAKVGVHGTADEVVRAAVGTVRELLGTDAALAASVRDDGGYAMATVDGVTEPAFTTIEVRPGLGLGGKVLAGGRPVVVDDYLVDPTITSDFVPIVAREDLRGMACVPVHGPEGVDALLYACARGRPLPGDVAIDVLRQIASHATVALHQIAARRRECELERLRERQRLALELHDSVSQMLFAIGVAARGAGDDDDPAVLSAALAEIEATAARARSDLRATLARLTHADAGVAFEALLDGEVRMFERSSGCRAVITRRGHPRPLGEPLEDLILGALREGLRNAVKHAGAETVLAHVAYDADRVLLSLQTDGDVAASLLGGGEPKPGSGLCMLRERARQLRGDLELRSRDGIVVLRLELPA